MSHARESGFHPSSPRSSSGVADSFGGTPDTRLTAFSPEGGSSDKSSSYMRSLIMIGPETPPARVAAAPNCDHGPGTQLDRDPFVTPTPDSRPPQRLSPTASAFRPFACPAHVGMLQAVPDPHGVAAAAAAAPEEPLLPNLSNNLGLSRCLYLAPVRQGMGSADIKAYLQVEQSSSQRYGSMLVVCSDKGGPDWPIYVGFSDIRDAAQLFRNICMLGRDMDVKYMPSADFKKVQPADQMIDLDGQLSITAVIAHPGSTDVAGAMIVVQQVMQSHGPVAGFVKTTGFEHGALRGIVEYCNASDAKAASAGYSGIIVDGVHMTLVPVRDDVAAYWPMSNYSKPADLSVAFHNMTISGHGGVATPTMATVSHHQTGSSCQTVAIPVHPQVHPAFQLVPLVCRPQFPEMQYLAERGHPGGRGLAPHGPIPSMPAMYSQLPTPLTAFRREDGYGAPRTGLGFGRGDSRRQHAARVTRSPYFSTANHHNHVDIGRIRDGIDVRTTIMLRNIPNKVDQAMLKRIVDESSWGKYDFMYLRIDFSNDCNVGYAFINFVDPLDIIDFVNIRGNQRWNCFKSDKVAEISYATIQGKDCLVQKFRNSSVMLEPPHYRPKLYFTSNGPSPGLAGQEETFPEPDNPSKMKRSCENAEHVGLFTPNAGQHLRDEQRRRRSQFDRGSRFAAAEEYGSYEAALRAMYGRG